MKKTILDNKGLTLVELMVVMVLSLVLMGSVYMAYRVQDKNAHVQQQVSTMQQDMRAVLDIMETDIRHCGCNPGNAQSIEGIVSSTSGIGLIKLTMDLDSDRLTTSRGESVVYTQEGNDLVRIDGSERQVLASCLTTGSLNFSYFDKDAEKITPTGPSGTLTETQSGNVRSVEVDIAVQSEDRDPDTGEFIQRRLQRTIMRRN